jgi:GH24 family phage-related lysozyme (muramidase)
MPDSNDLKSIDSQLKKTLISAESFKKGSSVDVSKSILKIQKTFTSLIDSVRQLVTSVVSIKKIVDNNSLKINSLKNISKIQKIRITGESIGSKLLVPPAVKGVTPPVPPAVKGVTPSVPPAVIGTPPVTPAVKGVTPSVTPAVKGVTPSVPPAVIGTPPVTPAVKGVTPSVPPAVIGTPPVTPVSGSVPKLIDDLKKLNIKVIDIEKIVNNNSRKITSLKNISKTQSTRISGENIGAKLPGSSTSNVEDSITKIAESVASIAEILAGRQKALNNAAAFDRRKAEQEKRRLAEGNLEKKFKGLKSAAEKIIAPVKSILDRIIDFFVTVFLGRVVYKLLEWFGDKKNADKVKSIGRFLKDFGPAILAAFVLFGTSFGRLTLGLTKMIGGFIFKIGKVLIPQLLKLIARNPVAAAKAASVAGVAVGAGLLANEVTGQRKAAPIQADQQSKVNRGKTIAVQGTDSMMDKTPSTGNLGPADPMQGLGANGGGLIKKFFSGGLVPAFKGGGFNFKDMLGGMGNMSDKDNEERADFGFVSGEKGVDKIPAMLSDGEFVMSAGAVKKYGVDTLEGMNAAGGGTNKPKMMSGTTYASGGGAIGTASHHLKQDESLSSLTKGINDFTNPKSPNWSKVTAKTPVHSYIDSVGQPTIGWGSTYYDSILNGKQPVRRGDTITKDKADNILSTNISGLQKEYSTKIPYWNKMNDNQKAGLLILGYNAPYGPIGAYKKLTAALQQGDMKTAATNVQRGGPNAQRIALERRLLMSGPLNLKNLVGPRIVGDGSKPQSQKPQNAFQQFGSSVASNVMNFFGQPAQAKPVSTSRGSGGDVNTTKPLPVPYEKGGYAPKSARPTSPIASSKSVPRPTIKPLTPPKPRIMYVPAPSSQSGGGYGGSASTSVPSFSATAPGGNAKQKTLGVTR